MINNFAPFYQNPEEQPKENNFVQNTQRTINKFKEFQDKVKN